MLHGDKNANTGFGAALALTVFALLSGPAASVAAPPTSKQLLLAHYMPWYEADPARNKWGWHWTMNHFQPGRLTNGKREAASHYVPLIGLYDSNDPDALECHVLLMKLSGIDGVVIDWYGNNDYLDYGLIHRNTQHLIRFVKKAGLRYVIMYEDQTVPKLLAEHRLPDDDVVAHGQRLLQWMQKHWFTDPAYLTRNKQPIFMTFGNGYYTGEQWNQIFSGLTPSPLYFTESHRRPPAIGGFSWPQPAGGTEAALKEQNRFFGVAKTWSDFVPAAFPRFHDVYEKAGVHKSWGRIEDQKGKTYASTLEQALKSKASLIQIATWNDWGEGTIIEPSVEFGYRDLETTQRLRRRYIEPRFSYDARDLTLPVALYRLRKKYGDDPKQSAKLEGISRLLFSGQTGKAKELLSRTR
ncbi:MAG: glycoside hydrolase family 99-like domain-containing protein [Fibrella sp.]|nr:glycoside hydrolase family 99-like domain-containing protein [Armatimonadota bacterium]